jgi:Tol biopolymer transport system component
MDELHDRFHRLDRIAAPDLWNEAVGRAAVLEGSPGRRFSPMMALIAAALLMASLVGTVAVGSWLNRPELDPLTVDYSNGVIAVADRCGRIIGIDAESSEASQLVGASSDTDCDEVMDLAWSSGGRWLAYAVDRSGSEGFTGAESEVWVRDTETGSESLVASCTGCPEVDISPDGSLVAFVDWNHEGVGAELVVARTDGRAAYRAPFVGSPGAPAFSPDGGTIAIPIRYATSGVHVLDVASLDEAATPAMRLLYGPVASQSVSWSPDGNWLAFDKEANGGWMEIWAIRPDGTHARSLTEGSGPFGPAYPTWSADSSTVAYIAGAPGPTQDALVLDLWTASLEGEITRVHRSPCCPWDYTRPAWSPDGEWIAFAVADESENESGLFLVRPDGSGLRRLSASVGEPAWQPLVEDR